MSLSLAAGARILLVYGTRPEAIKMAPVVHALRARTDRFDTIVCSTAQHREMTDQVEALLGFTPDVDLDLMVHNQTLSGLLAAGVAALDAQIERTAPDCLLVQGDTTTAMAAALASFNRGVPVGHVEAGLRTGDLARPFPEEANRRIIDVVTAAHFAPTKRARDALLAEGVDHATVHLTGNTVVDAVHHVAAGMSEGVPADEVLVTLHRRESFGAALAAMLGALRTLAEAHPSTRFTLPVHPNPSVRGPVHELLGGVDNLTLCDPLDYRTLVEHLRRARIVLTDSGGIQEEAPAFGVPVLVLRDRTERPEGIEAGVAQLVGTDPDAILAAATEALARTPVGARLEVTANPYGDGHAAERIVAILAGEPWEPFQPPTPGSS